MPVRSSSSSVLVWPTRAETDSALHQWAAANLAARDDVLRIGGFGSYARGTWGVGSDLDLVAIVRDSDVPFERRAIGWDATSLPVSTDLVIYTQAEWKTVLRSDTRFGRMLAAEVRWIVARQAGEASPR